MTNEGFKSFGKIARLHRDIVITEKIDGTNAQVYIAPEPFSSDKSYVAKWYDETTQTIMVMYAGSRTRWITPSNDNFGFAAWVQQNAEELRGLGEGRHFGEWWGGSIQRGYGEIRKHFSLFNTTRWFDYRPECCDVVPILYQGEFTMDAVEGALSTLREIGSMAAPGYMKPEGIIVYHIAANMYFKRTLEGDDAPKSKGG